MNRTLARRARRGLTQLSTDTAPETTSTILACLVGHNGLWASYVATPEQIEAKKQPAFFTGYKLVSELKKAIAEWHPAFNEAFMDYSAFWEKLREAGIEKPESMPHRETHEK